MAELDAAEQSNVFGQVWRHIQAQPDRQKKSVVVMSLGSIEPMDPNNLNRFFQKQRDQIKLLLDNDVPVVVASGNDALKKDGNGNLRKDIDLSPGIFEGPDFPLIVIGAVDRFGKPYIASQGGDHLTISAPGVAVRCQYRDNDDEWIKSGTSFGRSRPSSLLL